MEAVYHLLVDIDARLRGSGNAAQVSGALNSIQQSAQRAASAFVPLQKAMRSSMAGFPNVTPMANNLRSAFAGISAAMAKYQSETRDIKTTTILASEAFTPLANQARAAVLSVSSLDEKIVSLGTSLLRYSEQTQVSSGELKAWAFTLKEFDKLQVKRDPRLGALNKVILGIKEEITRMPVGVDIAGKEIEVLGNRFVDAVAKMTALPPAMQKFYNILAQGGPLTASSAKQLLKYATVVSRDTTASFASVSQAAREAIPALQWFLKAQSQFASMKVPKEVSTAIAAIGRELPTTAEGVERLKVQLLTAVDKMKPGMETVKQQFITATQALDQYSTALKSVQMPPAIAAFYKALERGNITTSYATTNLLKLAQSALVDTTVGFESARGAIARTIPVLEKLTHELLNTDDAQRRLSSSHRGMVTHSKEGQLALNGLQSVAQGAMLGMGLLSGSILQIGFSLIFLRFSEVNVALSTGVLVAALAGLTKILAKVGKSIKEATGKFIEMREEINRLARDSKRLNEAFKITANAAIKAGRGTDDLVNASKILQENNSLTGQTLHTVANMAAYLGVSMEEASEQLMQAIESDELALKGFDKAIIDSEKAWWKLQTPAKRLQTLSNIIAREAPDAAKKYADSWKGIKDATANTMGYIQGKLGEPFVDNFLAPILKGIRDFAFSFKQWLDSWTETEEAKKIFESFSKSAERIMKGLNKAFSDLGNTLKVVLPIAAQVFSVALTLISTALAVVARFAKILIPIFTILGALLVKMAAVTLFKYLMGLEKVQMALRVVRVQTSTYAFRLAVLNNMLINGVRNLRSNTVALAQNTIATYKTSGAMGLLSAALMKVRLGFTALNTVIKKNPLMAIVAILSLVVLAVMANKDAMAALRRALESFMPIIEALADAFNSLIEPLGLALVPLIQALGSALSIILVPVFYSLAILLDHTLVPAVEGFAWALSLPMKALGEIGKGIGWLVTKIMSLVGIMDTGINSVDKFNKQSTILKNIVKYTIGPILALVFTMKLFGIAVNLATSAIALLRGMIALANKRALIYRNTLQWIIATKKFLTVTLYAHIKAMAISMALRIKNTMATIASTVALKTEIITLRTGRVALLAYTIAKQIMTKAIHSGIVALGISKALLIGEAFAAGAGKVALIALAIAKGIATAATWSWNAALAVMNFLMGGIPIIIGAIVAAIAALAVGIFFLIKNFSKVSDWIKKNWKLLLMIIAPAVGLAMLIKDKYGKQMVAGFKAVYNKVKDFLVRNWKTLMLFLAPGIGLSILIKDRYGRQIVDGVKGALEFAKKNLKKYGLYILGIIFPLAGLSIVIFKYWDRIKGWFGRAISRAKGWLKESGKTILKFLFPIMFVGQYVGNFVKSIIKNFEEIKEKAIEYGPYIIAGLFPLAGLVLIIWKFKDEIASFFVSIGETFASVGESIVNFFSELPDKIWEYVIKIRDFFIGEDGLWGKITNVASTIGETLGGFFQGAWQKITEWGGKIRDFFVGDEGIWEKITSAASRIKDVVIDVFQGMWEGIKPILNVFIDAINWIISGLNKISFEVPSWVPGVGGKGFGIDIEKLQRLAAGGITKPNTPVPVIVGDTRQREVIAPLDKLRDIMPTVAPSMGNFTVIVNVTGNTIANPREAGELSDKIARKVGREMRRFKPYSLVGY